jgi:hypothetical protein
MTQKLLTCVQKPEVSDTTNDEQGDAAGSKKLTLNGKELIDSRVPR